MIKCPNCAHQELEGTIFCGECGAQLIPANRVRTSHIDVSTGTGSKQTEGQIPDSRFESSMPLRITHLALRLLKSGACFSIPPEKESILGRASEKQSIFPDIDLSPYRAFEEGVSRLHATITASNAEVIITDLGSSNGTFVNGIKIEPKVPRLLKRGDVVSLGKLKFEIIAQEKRIDEDQS